MAAVADWTFEGTWPYEPKWFDSPDGRMHYVDEGPRDGRPVVMVHGNPTWGYLYRNFIPALVEAGHRAIVPDHLGFGRSEKPRDPELYRVPRHARRLDALLESLDLRGAVVVPQDWGGPIGLYWATQHPERVDGLFILNTFAHGFRREALPPGKDKIPLPLPLRLFRTPVVGEVLVKGLDAFKRGFLFGQGVMHKERLTPVVKRAYRDVHQGWADRTPILVFPREIPVTGEGPVIGDERRDRGGDEARLPLEAGTRHLGDEGRRLPAVLPRHAVAGHVPRRDGHEARRCRPLPAGGRARADRAGAGEVRQRPPDVRPG